MEGRKRLEVHLEARNLNKQKCLSNRGTQTHQNSISTNISLFKGLMVELTEDILHNRVWGFLMVLGKHRKLLGVGRSERN